MNLALYSLLIFNLLFTQPSTIDSYAQQENALHKKWRIISEETTYLNPDYSRHDGFNGRTDYSKSENDTIHFLPAGKFNSFEGNGTYTFSKDSLHMVMDKESSFAYRVTDSTLTLSQDYKTTNYLKRITLNLKATEI